MNDGTSPRTAPTLGYVPALDGLRAFAVLSVMAFHARMPRTRWGYLGVDIFFTLSGFLITTILLGERAKTGRISFRNFYARRALRLLPALGLLLLASVVVPRGAQLGERARAMAAALFYSTNWARAFDWKVQLGGLEHTWSLSIEEQFYLLWPLLLVGLLRFARRGLPFLLAIAVLASQATRIALCLTGHAPERLYNGLDTHCDGLLLGALLAVLAHRYRLEGPRPNPVIVHATMAVFVLGAAVVLAPSEWHDEYMFVIGYPLVALATCCVLYLIVIQPSPRLVRVLELPALTWVGRISYGLYLWHYFLFGLIHHIHAPQVVLYALMFGASFAAAGTSYYVIERRFLAMKSKYTRSGTG